SRSWAEDRGTTAPPKNAEKRRGAPPARNRRQVRGGQGIGGCPAASKGSSGNPGARPARKLATAASFPPVTTSSAHRNRACYWCGDYLAGNWMAISSTVTELRYAPVTRARSCTKAEGQF